MYSIFHLLKPLITSFLKTSSLLATPLIICVFVILSGCNTNSTNPMESLNPGSLAIDFPDGSEFLSSNALVSNQSSEYVLTATNGEGLPQDEINLSIPENATLPYTAQGTDGTYIQFFNANNQSTYEANSAQGYCSVTVTQISPTFEGTFTARVVCTTIPDSIVLSNGAFNATYQ